MVEIQYEGYNIRHMDGFWASKIRSLFSGMENSLLEAIHCLDEFNKRKNFIDKEHRNWAKFDAFTRYLPGFYAKSFVFALDSIGKILTQLAKLSESEDIPTTIVDIKDEFYAHFTDLTSLRNSFHHYEDRSQGNAFGNKINIQEANHEVFEQPTKFLMLGTFSGNKYSCTGADGNLASIEISEENLVKAVEFIQKAINLFTWTGGGTVKFP